MFVTDNGIQKTSRKYTSNHRLATSSSVVSSVLLLLWVCTLPPLDGMRLLAARLLYRQKYNGVKQQKPLHLHQWRAAFFSRTNGSITCHDLAPSGTGSSRINEEEWQCLPFNQPRPTTIVNLLVCGDGDLSYSASIASTLQKLGIKMTSTVLETKENHGVIYSQSDQNHHIIESFGHTVHFGIDATNLQIYHKLLSSNSNSSDSCYYYDRIQFNFPHCPGKTNIRYNRLLLQAFLRSASGLLSHPHGEIHVALFANQGGASAKSLPEWKASWLSTHYGAECGLLLASVTPFDCQYKRSSYRGQDKSFNYFSNNVPELYKFIRGASFTSSCYSGQVKSLSLVLPIPNHLQLCFRHELHIHVAPSAAADNNDDPQQNQIHALINGDLIKSKIQETLPSGVLVDVPFRQLIKVCGESSSAAGDNGASSSCSQADEDDIICFLIVYRGEKRPIKRNEADYYRDKAEQVIGSTFTLRKNRTGKSVSRPFPYYVLQSIITDKKNQA